MEYSRTVVLKLAASCTPLLCSTWQHKFSVLPRTFQQSGPPMPSKLVFLWCIILNVWCGHKLRPNHAHQLCLSLKPGENPEVDHLLPLMYTHSIICAGLVKHLVIAATCNITDYVLLCRLTGDDKEVKLRCAKAWSGWELNTLKLIAEPETVQKRLDNDEWALAFARIEW